MAASVTWGVKVPEELKQQLESLMQEAGLNGKDFAESLVDSYLSRTMKEKQPLLATEFEELQTHIHRINQIYINLGQRVETFLDEKEQKHQDDILLKSNSIEELSLKVKKLEIDLLAANDINYKLNEGIIDASQRSKDLEDMVDTNKQLVVQYKEKNDTLTGIVNEYQTYKDQYNNIKSDLENMTLQKNTIAIDLREAQRTIETLKIKMSELDVKYKETIDSISIKNTEYIDTLKNRYTEEHDKLKQRHLEEIEHITQKVELEKDKAALQIRNEYNDKIENIRNEYNAKIKSLFDDMQSSKSTIVVSDSNKNKEE